MPSVFAPLTSFLSSLSRKPSSGRYRPELDGLRCLAILIVMVWHASLKVMRFTSDSGITENAHHPQVMFIPDGAVGVQLFFFLSGFVIFIPFISRNNQINGQFIMNFYRSRLIRIFPPYACVILASYLAIAVLGLTPQKASTFEMVKTDLTSSLLASLFYMHGLIYLSPPKLNPPGWSLEIEMQFYLLFPLIFIMYIKIRNCAARISFAFFAVLFFTMLRIWMVNKFGDYGYFRWTLINYFSTFILGIAIADLTWSKTIQNENRKTWPDLIFIVSFFVLLLAGVMRDPNGWVEQSLVDMSVTLAISGIYYGATHGRISNWLLSRPAVFSTGAACYSIYLTHMIVMHFTGSVLFKHVNAGGYFNNWLIGMVVMIPAALIAGFVFYVFVERTFIRLAAGQSIADKPTPATARIV